MEKSPEDPHECIESELADIGMVPLAATQRWRGMAMRAAMNGAVDRAGDYHVYEQSACPD